jgi:hypothetical protein
MARDWLRGNAFLVAAIGLPVAVVLLFVVATAVPAWLVDAPAYDLVLSVAGARGPNEPPVEVSFAVNGERVEAVFRRVAANTYPQRYSLFVIDHASLVAREIPVAPPADLDEDGTPRTVVVAALADRRVLAQVTAPDGYAFDRLDRRGPGLVGEIFGMRRTDQVGALVKRGRVERISLPDRYRYQLANALGWIADEAP